MKDDYALFFKRVLEDEGTGYEDVPGDSGGPTCCGITIADVARWNNVRCPKRGAPGWDELVAKVRALTPATAAPIYKAYYWDAVRADELPSGIDYCTVDYGVNSGPHRSVPTLGHLVGISGDAVTDQMLNAVDTYPGGQPKLINTYQDTRRDFLIHISDPNNPDYAHNAKFRNGWLTRVERVRRVALSLAGKADPEPHDGMATGSVKANGVHPDDAVKGIAPAAPEPDLPAPAADQHPVVVAVKHPITWGLAGFVAACQQAVTHITGWFSGAAGNIDIQKIANDTQNMVTPSTSILDIVHARSPEVDLAIGAVCLAIVLFHVFKPSGPVVQKSA